MDIKRVASALLGFPLVVLILTFGNKYVVDIFLMGIAILAMQEYFNAVQKECRPVRWLGYLSCVFIGLIHIVPENIPSEATKYILLLLIPTLMLLAFSQVIITNMKTNFKDIAYTVFGILYIVTCISFIALIRGMDKGVTIVWYAIIAAWGTDTFAYLIGKKFGKHKLSQVSPKKSVEGCIAGTVGAVFTAIIYTLAINNIYNLEISYLYIIVVTIIISLIGQIGDFAASSIKRYVNVKDYSNLIPGHGGMLDRIDSLMFLAPFAYIFYTIGIF